MRITIDISDEQTPGPATVSVDTTAASSGATTHDGGGAPADGAGELLARDNSATDAGPADYGGETATASSTGSDITAAGDGGAAPA